MAGTDHAKAEEWGGPQPVVILVRPQLGENIGAAARAMLNFGLEHMRLVDPRDGWPNPSAVATASGAARVLDGVRVDASTEAACADFTTVYATTARARELSKPVLTPQEAMADAAARIRGGERVAVLFGPERAGLENADLNRANIFVSVPVNPGFASLNLAQCVLLLAYEWGRARQLAPPPARAETPATRGQVAALTDRLESRLDEARFFWPEEKRASMIATLRNFFARMPLTDADVRLLHGIVRALGRRPD